MNEDKIKKSFDTVIIPDLPSSEYLYNKYEEYIKEKKTYKTDIFYLLRYKIVYGILILFIILPISIFILLTIEDVTNENELNITPRLFNYVFDLTCNIDDEDNIYLLLNKKYDNAIYEDVNVTIQYLVNDGEGITEYVKIIEIKQSEIKIPLCNNDNNYVEGVSIVDAEGTVIVTDDIINELNNKINVINSFYNKIYSYNKSSYVYESKILTDYFEKNYDFTTNEVSDVKYDYNNIREVKGYVREDYYKYLYSNTMENKKSGFINESKADFVLMYFQDRPCLITNYNIETPNGKLGIDLDFYNTMSSAKLEMIKKDSYLDVDNFLSLLDEKNINLSQINLIKDNDIYKFRGSIKDFYLLKNKLFDPSLFSYSKYKDLLDDEIELVITLKNESINIAIEFSSCGDRYGYVSNRPLYPNEFDDENKIIIDSYEIMIELNETYRFIEFDDSELNNYIYDENIYTYKPADSIKDVYKEEYVEKVIHIEYYNDLGNSYHKVYLEKGQYVLNDTGVSNNIYRDIAIYDDSGNLLNIGYHNNNPYFDSLSRTFAIYEDGYYYIEVAGGQKVIEFIINKIIDNTYYDINHPNVITSGEVMLDFDSNFDMVYCNYKSNEDGLIKVTLNNDELWLYAYNPTSSGYYFYNNQISSSRIIIDIKEGDNILIFGFKPYGDVKYFDVCYSADIEFYGSESGYSENIENMPVVTEDFFDSSFSPLVYQPVYLKLIAKETGQYTFIFDSENDKLEYYVYNEQNVKIGEINSDKAIILEKGIYVIKAVTYYFEGGTFNIKYSYSSEYNELENGIDVVYSGGSQYYEYEFSTEITSLRLEFNVTFTDEYIVRFFNVAPMAFELEIYDENNNLLCYSNWGNKISKGLYRFVFIAKSQYNYKPSFSIIENKYCTDPYEPLNDGCLTVINNMINITGYDDITQENPQKIILEKRSVNGNRIFIKLKVIDACEVACVISNDVDAGVIIGDKSYRLNNESLSISFEVGVHLLEIRCSEETLILEVVLNN